MQKFFRWIGGYLSIDVSGISPERFMNLCVKANIPLMNVCHQSGCCHMELSLRDFYKIKQITRKSGVKVAVKQRYGLPFLMKTIEKKSVFFLGLCFCILFLTVMRNYVWAMDFYGNQRVTDDMLSDFLVNHNIEHGTTIRSLDYEFLEHEIRKEFEDIIWVSVGMEGTKLNVYVKEKDVGVYEHLEYNTLASNLVSSHQGTIASIVTRSGVPMVKEGDVVQKGDVLISGMLPIPAQDGTVAYYNPTNADGDILITHDISYYDTVSKFVQSKKHTGNEKNNIRFRFFQLEFTVWGFKNNFAYAEEYTDYRQLCILDHFYLPIWLGFQNSKEYRMVSKNRSTEEMELHLKNNMQEFIASFEEKGVQIIEKDVKIYDGGFYMECDGRIRVEEQAIERVPIDPQLFEPKENAESENSQ